MNYVFKIVGDFNEKTFQKILSKISPNFVFIYLDKTLFLASKHYIPDLFSRDQLYNFFKPQRDYYIEEITEKNISSLAPIAKEWCLNNLVRLDTEKYEYENQDKLHKVWDAMDNMEAELRLKKKNLQ